MSQKGVTTCLYEMRGNSEEFIGEELEGLKGGVANSYYFTMKSHALDTYGLCSLCAKTSG